MSLETVAAPQLSELTREHTDLLALLENRTATIGVVGLGYVGLPLAVEFAANGFKTIGIDLDHDRIRKLNAGENYIQDVDGDALRTAVDDGRFIAESDYGSAGSLDVIFICVPTPVTAYKDPDTAYIEAAARSLASSLRQGQLFVLKSTTYPNTTEGLVLPILQQQAEIHGWKVGRDFFVAFSPERIDPGNKVFDTSNTPIVVGGVTPACTSVAAAAMKQVVSIVHTVSSPRIAEMEKLLENIFRSVNIALVNEMARLCDRIGGVSIWEVIEAAATKPFGFMPFQPGPGLGGHCIPVDPYYLSWLARKYDFETSFITLSARINEEMPFYVIDSVVRAVAELPVRLEDARILVLGVAFKRDVDDTRHSPALKLMELLFEKGLTRVAFSDPHVSEVTVQPRSGARTLHSVDLTIETLSEYDVVVIATDHSGFDYDLIAEHASLIVDSRNAMSVVSGNGGKVRLLGGGSF
jgi:UDP-N-acetyl-D-glucosamine dehydrogenase